MNPFIEYELKVAVALAVFTLFYKLLLQKDTFHRFNRIVLLVTSALAFVLPFCVIVRHETVVLGHAGLAPGTLATYPAVLATDPISIARMNFMQFLETALAAAFFAGAAFMFIRIIYSIVRIRQLIAGGRHIPQDDGTVLVVVSDNDFSPVSWMKYIVMSEEDHSSTSEGILIHERAHIALGHSWDILFFDLMTVLQWFNPAIWLLKADLRAIHEYEADEAVIKAGTDMREYQLLLVRKAVAKVRYQAANSLTHSTLKNRIKMMSTEKSSFYGALKALYVLPLAAVSLVVNAETKYDYIQQEPEKIVFRPVPGAPYSKEFRSFVNREVRYPEEAKKDKAEDNVLVSFTVERDGSIANVKIMNKVHPAIAAEAMRAVSAAPKWNHNPGEPKVFSYILPIRFDIRSYESDVKSDSVAIDGNFMMLEEIVVTAY